MLFRRILTSTAVVATLVVAPTFRGPAAPTVSAQTVASGEVTFAKDIAPILQRSCQNCHRAERRRADAAHHLRRSAAVGARDQDSAPASARTPA